MSYRGVPSRYYRGSPCCDDKAPFWWDVWPTGRTPDGKPQDVGGPLNDAESAAAEAINSYGAVWLPERYVYTQLYNTSDGKKVLGEGESKATMLSNAQRFANGATLYPIGAQTVRVVPAGFSIDQYDRNVPRIRSVAELPSLPQHRYPGTGLPDPVGYQLYERRERAKKVTSVVPFWDEKLGRHVAKILWCSYCGPDVWEQFVQDLGQTFTETLVPLFRGLAVVFSYVPVLGTAVSFLMNATISMLEGKGIDAAVLDGIGGALPGQPMSKMAFDCARSLVKGDRVDQVVLNSVMAALPVPPEVKQYATVAVGIAIDIASGRNINDFALSMIRQQLPESGQQAMDVARRVADGENVGNMISMEMMEAGRQAASQGKEAVNAFIAQAGFQNALDMLPWEAQDAIKAGIAIGTTERTPETVPMFGSVPETNQAVNETHVQKGQRIVSDPNTKYMGVKLSDILLGPTFTIDIDQPDALTGIMTKRRVTFSVNGPWGGDVKPLNDAWRRGFLVATGACDGMSVPGPGQIAIYQTMAEVGGRDGFLAGQAVAHYRTQHSGVAMQTSQNALTTKVSLAPKPVVTSTNVLSVPGASLRQSLGLPTNLTAATPEAPPPVRLTLAMVEQKARERDRWVAHYNALG